MKLALFVVLWSLFVPWSASASTLKKDALLQIRFDQRIGESVPMDLELLRAGENVTLAKVGNGKPVVLALVYNRCPMLCDQLLHGVLGMLKVLDETPGDDFTLMVASFDPNEDPTITAGSRSNFLRRYGRPGADSGVSFLTGTAPAIDTLTEAVGFRYRYDEVSKEFAHPSGLVVLTPEGKVARYFFGTEFSPRDMRLALREASNGEVGSVTDDLLLLCYQYDPQTGTYSSTVVNIIRLGGVATLLALALFIGRSLKRERRRGSEAAP